MISLFYTLDLLSAIMYIILAMGKSSVSGFTRKEYFRFKEVEKLYKMIDRYSLRSEAYKKLLQVYINFKKKDL